MYVREIGYRVVTGRHAETAGDAQAQESTRLHNHLYSLQGQPDYYSYNIYMYYTRDVFRYYVYIHTICINASKWTVSYISATASLV